MSSELMDNKPNIDQENSSESRRSGGDRRTPMERRRGSNRLLEVIVSRSRMAKDRRQDRRRTADVEPSGWGFWRSRAKAE